MINANKQIDADRLRAYARQPENVRLACELIALKAAAIKTRKLVDAVARPIYENYRFLDAEGQLIPYQEDCLYHCVDQEFVKDYQQERDLVLRFHLPSHYQQSEYCPALLAEGAVLAKEREILDSISSLMGFDGIPGYTPLEWKTLVELFVMMALGK